MPEFLQLLSPQEALKLFLQAIDDAGVQLEMEEIETAGALGRVLAEPVIAPIALPEFPRSTVDGYAVRAQDTYGASESLPAYLVLNGEIPMGETPDVTVTPHSCVLIHTGGMIPEGANAVVMLEDTQIARDGEVEILKSVALGENVIQTGEDVRQGEQVILAGTRLRPPEIGGLMAFGLTRVRVWRKPVVGIVSSGDEVVAPEAEPHLGQVRDVNAYTLSSLVEIAGGVPRRFGIVGDSKDELQTVLAAAMQACEMVVVTAGSSASVRDITAEVINRMGSPGVLVHGVNIRPGKPTILGISNRVVMVGLPGNPVSALVNSYLFIKPAIRTLLGEISRGPAPSVKAVLSINLVSRSGREEWVPVKIREDGDGYLAEPIFGRSNLIFSLARSSGLICIPAEANGIAAGTVVDVFYL